MELIAFKLVFVAFAVFTVSAVNKGEDDLIKILATERAEMREERKQLTAERQEMREMFRRETARLDEEDKRMKEQNEKQQDQIAKLRQQLRRANAKIKQSIRQNDQNNSLEVTKMDKFLRQDDLHSEVTKIVRNEMETFLKEETRCVSGRSAWKYGGKDVKETVSFGVTFPRKPTVIVSLVAILNYGVSSKTAKTGSGEAHVSVVTGSISKSSAVIHSYAVFDNNRMNHQYTWLACL